ncbi:MAG: tRNA (adenosine(37)-N6)-threonylcarbamoyltransferase complex ATPase subunit type 1 TsaE [bacterium]|nr:tRNA (adenosine(37)-N6)-threonylcarbamoyltransferase complex ATPase subunit type 1 TsaE [bacterium]
MHKNPLIAEHNVANLEKLSELASNFASELQTGDVVFLSGQLGAGKTTFTQSLGKALGVQDAITSPTFTLVGEYQAKNSFDITSLVHIDLYRTGDQSNAQPLSLNNNYIHELVSSAKEQKAVVVIEWGELLGQKIKNRTWHIDFKQGAVESERIVTIARNV